MYFGWCLNVFLLQERRIWPVFQPAWPAGQRISTRPATRPAGRPDRCRSTRPVSISGTEPQGYARETWGLRPQSICLLIKILTKLVLQLSKDAKTALINFDTTSLVCLLSVKFTAFAANRHGLVCPSLFL